MSSGLDFHAFLRESMIPMHNIENNLFLGNMAAANDENLLRTNQITCIVQCLPDRNIVQHFPFITYHYVPVDDLPMENIKQHVPQAINFIHRNLSAGKAVLVHCAAGVSRSSTIVVAYYMAKYGLQFQEAKERVKSRRQCVCPNMGFENQLKQFSIQDLRSFIA